MGISYHTCAKCSRNFPDCGDFTVCDSCEAWFCSYECADLKDTDKYDKYNEEIKNCVLCRKEFITDEQILDYLLKKFNLDKDKIIEEIKNDSEE